MVKHGLKGGKWAGAAQAETFTIAKKRQGNLANTAKADTRAEAFTGGWAGDGRGLASGRQGNTTTGHNRALRSAMQDTQCWRLCLCRPADVDVILKGEAVKLVDPTAPAAAVPAPAAAAANGSSRAAAPAAAASPPPAAPAAAAAPQKTVASAASGAWTEAQELALVKACKSVAKDAEDRWEAIAALVPGKTKAQCFRRFKELKESFKAKKAAAA